MKFKPYWNDELRNQWSKVSVYVKTWLYYTGAKRNTRNVKDAYCIGIANDRKRAIPLAVVDNNGSVTNNKTDILNKWKSHFESLFRYSEERNEQLDRTSFDTDIDVNIVNEPISRDEVLQAVIHAKFRKAFEIDNIPAEVLKNDCAVELLFKIINGCLI